MKYSIVAALVLVGCSSQPPKTDMEYREAAAIDMLRLGMQRWQIACALAAGHDRRNLEQATRSCMVDLKLGSKP